MATSPRPRRPAVKKLDPSAVQRQASDPSVSAWVTASAGTGKTQVLTDRTLRLMLDGATPDQILAITFTRAAASVMTNRIRDVLSVWATCDDKTLDEKLKRLTGRLPDEKTKTRARQLYAEFLDAHGDMRIQTVHSFAQSLLRRFPIESGVPPYFDVMDDQTVAEELRIAQAEVLRQIGDDSASPLARAVGLVTPEVSEDDFISLIGELASRRGQLKTIFRENGGLEGTIDAVYTYLDARKGATPQELTGQIVSAGSFDALKRAAEIFATGTPAEREKAGMLQAWLAHPERRIEWFEDYKKIFLTAEGEVRKKLTTKATAAAEEIMQAEALRLTEGIDGIRTLHVALETESLLRMTDAILQNYENKKRSLNLLDYDDLVYRAGQMMKKDDRAMSWALEKLPGNLKHILIDEGQDTNPDQWELVSSIVREFFSKKGKGNTLFVVGDEKQSIFSFQRADPDEFAARKKEFAGLVQKTGGKWREVEMTIAFRSSPAITQAVDAVFANPAASDGLFHDDGTGEQKVSHDPFRRGQSGIVEVHPIAKHAEPPETDPWTLPLKTEAAADPSVELADQIADKIKGWLDSGEKLESRDRPISPADIMILVRRRSDFVDHMVRALKKRNIPVAGADRISLREQIVVMDLMALGEVLLFPKDEYKLACVLKSPLIGMTDQQLEDLALDRTADLWETLKNKASDPEADKVYAAAYEYLHDLQNKVGTERPYDLYSSIMLAACPATGKSALTSLYGRLGYEAEDPLVEFMNALEQFEKIHVPDLRGFLSWMEAGEAEVKREININPEQPLVHIMTVHGAKGLEAPIVILPDTIGIPSDNPRARPKFLWPAGDRKVPLWTPHAELENRVYARERELAELERDREFRRLLYVAMTRAGDRLYVYGDHEPKNQNNFAKSWYNLIRTGLQEHAAEKLEIIPTTPAPVDPDTPPSSETILRLAEPQTAKPVLDHVKPIEKERVVGTPLWARRNPDAGQGAVPRFRPSQAGSANDNIVRAPSPLNDTASNDYYKNLGTAVHALLEILPHLPAQEREDAAREYLSQPALAIKENDQLQTLGHVSTVLNHPEFSALFGPGSRAEVSISGYVEKDGKKQLFNGLIDRLVVTDTSVMIVDFKNNLKVPKDVSEVSNDYLLQLAAYKMALQQIYPDKEIKCALLYTREAKLIALPADKMAEAIRQMDLKEYTPPQKQAGPRA